LQALPCAEIAGRVEAYLPTEREPGEVLAMKTTRRTLFGMLAGMFAGFGVKWAKPAVAASAVKPEDYTVWAFHMGLGELPSAVNEHCIWTRFEGGSDIGWAANFYPVWGWRPPQSRLIRAVLNSGLKARVEFRYPSGVVWSALRQEPR
jgi:hypothetical protein